MPVFMTLMNRWSLPYARCCAAARGAVEMALFAKAKEPFLPGFLKLENGLSRHETFSRLFGNLDPDQSRACFQQFMAEFSAQCQGVVAIDGRFRAVRSTGPAANRRCTWSAPRAANSVWCRRG
jgi:hypothetical protein